MKRVAWFRRNGIAIETKFNRRAAAGLFGAGALSLGLASEGCAIASEPVKSTGRLMFAGDHGIVGDGSIDETARVQAFLDLCRDQGGWVAHFGTMRVRISGPLTTTVGIVFDPMGYGANESPGFYVTGSGYTALTVTGGIADFNVTVAGYGEAKHGPDGSIIEDTRPKINGIAFGGLDEKTPLVASVIRQARAFKLAGFGIRHTTCYDCTFLAISVEMCGTADRYAFEISGSAAFNCSESVWVRLQVEVASCRAIYVHPNTLSCAISKLHSERGTAHRRDPFWILGGACTYGAVRLAANNPRMTVARIIGQETTITNLRVDNVTEIPVEVDAGGGHIVFHNPVATLTSFPNQTGRIAVFGGAVEARRLGPGWSFFGVGLAHLEVGHMADGQVTVSQCEIGMLMPQVGQTVAAVRIEGSTIHASSFVNGNGRFASVELLSGTRCTSKPSLRVAYQTVTVDQSSTIIGDVILDHGALRLMGTIDGDLTVVGPAQSLAGMDAVVTGAVTGWKPPEITGQLGPHRAGMFCKNLGTGNRERGAAGLGWIYSGEQWVTSG